jgi:hypothetical protein
MWGEPIYVIGTDQEMYVSEHLDDGVGPVFYHSSFFSGEAILAAGGIETTEEGRLVSFNNCSGHYKPRSEHTANAFCFFINQGIDPETFSYQSFPPEFETERDFEGCSIVGERS